MYSIYCIHLLLPSLCVLFRNAIQFMYTSTLLGQFIHIKSQIFSLCVLFRNAIQFVLLNSIHFIYSDWSSDCSLLYTSG